MSCDQIQSELSAYHFGVVSDETRAQLEAHLVVCPACLKAFLALKREIETAASGPRPSELARRRLRSAVARELGVDEGEKSRRWSWWERPLAFAFAAAAVLLCMLAVGVVASSPGKLPYSLREAPPPALHR
jgi:anti-sigma factor RsiW